MGSWNLSALVFIIFYLVFRRKFICDIPLTFNKKSNVCAWASELDREIVYVFSYSAVCICLCAFNIAAILNSREFFFLLFLAFFQVCLLLWFIAGKNLILSLFWDRICAIWKNAKNAGATQNMSKRGVFESGGALLKGVRLYKITHMLFCYRWCYYSSENCEIQCSNEERNNTSIEHTWNITNMYRIRCTIHSM